MEIEKTIKLLQALHVKSTKMQNGRLIGRLFRLPLDYQRHMG